MFFPLRDENPTSRTAWVTIALILANAAIFALEVAVGPEGAQAIVSQYGLVPAEFVRDASAAWPTLVTSMFLHGGFLHLGGNLLYLWIFGNNVEEVLGPVRFALFYALVGFGAHFAHVITDPSSPVPTIGASGAIAGVLAAYLVRYPGARVLSAVFLVFFIRVVRIPASLMIGAWLLLQIVGGASRFGAAGDSGGIAWFEHLGGFVAGLVLFRPLGGTWAWARR